MTKALIVDDSRWARTTVIARLRAVAPAWSIAKAANADEALVAAARERPDIALIDFNMPGRDGLALAAELKSLYPGMQLAIISANIQAETKAGAHALGAAFLAKPLADDALTELVTVLRPGLPSKSG